MNKTKPYFLKRIVAYFIDLLIVTIISSMLSTIFINNTEYKAQSEKLFQLTSDYTSGKITSEEYSKEFDDINYFMTRSNIEITIINCGVALVYYVILCYYCNGITLGKYLLKLRIVSANDKDLNLGNYLIRGLLVNLILSNIISVFMVTVFSKEIFISVYPKINNVLTLFLLASILFMMYREDGRGLHDLISGTMIISTKELVSSQDEDSSKKDKIKDAEIIKEKKRIMKKNKNNESGENK